MGPAVLLLVLMLYERVADVVPSTSKFCGSNLGILSGQGTIYVHRIDGMRRASQTESDTSALTELKGGRASCHVSGWA